MESFKFCFNISSFCIIIKINYEAVLTACLHDDIITLTKSYILDFTDAVRKTDIADRYLSVIISAFDQPLVTYYKPVTLETAKTWFSLCDQVWTPYSHLILKTPLH